ncbi:MAG TPA: SDR family NAD(P)-dependent oxidoreductase, partial [Amycolatopsis sp.]|nr:SDR family NAD(P)-dependent oxidoreductase [Amycolatopsis sp.]
FAGAIRALLADGHRTFVECGAHPSLALGLTELAEEGGTDATVVSTLRRGAGGLDRFLDAAGELHVRGVRVDWAALSPDGARVPLPTYPFQRQRFWLDGPAGVRASGLDSAEHPLLDATLDLAGSARVFIGRISLADQPWLADHTVGGTVLLPGTACVELAAHAAARVGLGRVAELALSAPMFVPDGEGLSVQVTLGDAAPSGARSVTVHSRPSGSDEPWTEHAAGFVESASADAAEPAESWPPAGAAMVGVDAVYERLGAFGLGYGPAFRGLRRMWRRDGELFAEVSSPVDAAGYGVHPALFDAALHAFLADRLDAGTAGEDLLLPFSLHGVTVHRTGATALRVRLVPGAGADEFGVFASDAAGRPVFSVESLSLRPVAVERLRSHRRDALFRLDWLPAAPTGEPPLRARCAVLGADGPDLGPRYADLRELAAAERVPEVVFARVDAVGDALELLQDWVGDERFAGSRLAVVTSATELAGAAARGLVRSAQAEHPGRMVLIDGEASNDTLLAALATGEPEVAVGPGVIRVPRLVRIGATGRRAARTPAGTVLITGGLGALGALVARHLVTARGARSLLLVGRRGDRTPGATELVAELTELGAMVTVAACDIADRAALAEVIAAIPAERPLTSVIHAAGVTDDGVLTALDQDRLHRVLRPKLVAAVHLHELTREHDLDEFVLFSSLAGVLGNPGQANYAAANAALDALAETRRALGLPGQSLAWGLWADESAVSSGLGEASVSTGVTPMSAADALALFDAATEVDLPVVVAAHLDLVALRGAPRLPRVLRSLVPDQPMAPHPAAPVLDDLTGLSRADRLARLVDLVRAKAALVLGHDGTSADGIEPDRAFKELGFDSLTAVELRNQLGASTGLRLSPTLVFDFPTPADLAAHLDTALSRPAGPDPVETAVDQVRSAAQGLDDASLAALTRRLKDLVREWTAGDTSVEVASASAEEL